MKKNTEGGYLAKERNFEKLITIVEELDKAYNPSDKKISFEELKKVKDNASKIMEACTDLRNSYKLSNSSKEELIKILSKDVTRIMLTLKGAGINKSIIEDARNVTSIFRAQKKAEVKLTSTDAPDLKNNKTHRRIASFQDKIEGYEALYNLLSKIKDYAPNEDDLSIEGIGKRLEFMQTLYSTNSKIEIQLDDLRNQRDKIFLAENIGLVALGRQTKNYLKSLFGPRSLEAKRLSPLKF